MSLQKRDKKPKKISLPVCPFCSAVAKHYGYQCPRNPKNKCKFCGGFSHTSIMCLQKPRKPIRKESFKSELKRQSVSKEWFKLNPPDINGNWICYLNISPQCPRALIRKTITLEHVKSKVRYPALKYEVTNLKAACEFCNKLKGSWDVEQLPEVLNTLQLPEGRTWANVLDNAKNL